MHTPANAHDRRIVDRLGGNQDCAGKPRRRTCLRCRVDHLTQSLDNRRDPDDAGDQVFACAFFAYDLFVGVDALAASVHRRNGKRP